MFDMFQRGADTQEKVNKYFQAKALKKPLLIGFGAKLTIALFDYYTVSTLDKRTREEKTTALLNVICAKYKNLHDIFNDDGYKALQFFFDIKAPIIKEVWHRTFDLSYQKGYLRRPYRTRFGLEAHFDRGLELLHSLIRLTALGFDLHEFLNDPHLNDPVNRYFSDTTAIVALLSYEIDRGNKTIREKVDAIVNENTGKLSIDILMALVQSQDAWAHELLGRTLLAAKLQEGLRQSIVELMDGGNTDTFRYLLKVILDNKLERFSSVVRGFDVWTGLPISAEKPATIRHYLEVINACVSDGKTKVYLESTNPVENYIALLCLSFYELEDGLAVIEQFLGHPNSAKRMIGWYWLSQARTFAAQMPAFVRHTDERTVDVLAYMLPCLWVDREKNNHHESSPGFVEHIRRIVEETPSKERQIAFPGITGMKQNYSHAQLYRYMLSTASTANSSVMFDKLCEYIEKMNVDTRIALISALAERGITTAKQQRTVLLAVGDKSDSVRYAANEQLKKLKLETDDYLELEGMLRFKADTLRKNIMLLLLRQKPEACLESVRRLSESEDANCRLAAEQLVQDMHAYSHFVHVMAEAKTIIGADSEIAVTQSEENGYGLYQPERLRHFDTFTERTSVNFHEAFPILDDFIEKVKTLSDLVSQHKNEIYEVEEYDGRCVERIYGADAWLAPFRNQDRRYILSDYPFADVFRHEIDRLFNEKELVQAIIFTEFSSATYADNNYKGMQKLYRTSGLENAYSKVRSIPYWHYIVTYLKAAFAEKNDPSNFEFFYGMALNILRELSDDKLTANDYPGFVYSWELKTDEQLRGGLYLFGRHQSISFWMESIHRMKLSETEFSRYFGLSCAYLKATHYQYGTYLPIATLVRAYRSDILGEDDVCFFLTRPKLRHLLYSATGQREDGMRFRRENSDLIPIVERVVDRIIDVELNRGEVPTTLSALAGQIGRCSGNHHFVRIVCAMDDRNYTRGYSFATDSSTKGQTLSYLLKHLYPAENDSADSLRQYPELGNLKMQKLINAVMYAPQWLAIVEEYLQIPGLRKAGTWFHAHLNEDFDNEKQAAIAHYSAIPPDEFQSGAFDPEWFNEALHEVGEKTFKMLYDAAKYIAGGSLHKRSQLFADAVMGKLNQAEIRERVSDKRNKDYLLALTLIPIENTTDALERYLFLEKFKKEGRQFGSQRQQSEKRACDIGIGNLARNAGYEDTNRFIWQMETRKLESVSKWFESVEVGGITVQVLFDEDGVASLQASKAGKQMASIPASSKKDPLFVEAAGVVKSLREQHRRAKATLERAMVCRDAMAADELNLLMQNPVLHPMLLKLLFISDGAVGFWREGQLMTVSGTPASVAGQIFIAHPYDLLQSGRWDDWQTHFCGEQIRQPFKQVFREYYCPTADELQEKTVSRRYAGHQIQPKKAARLATGRGWSTTEGLFKVYHREHIIAELFSGIVWFSPADIEPPVIEVIQFRDSNNGKPLDIASIPPILFSETMRDIDLIVSVAHFGAIDPEASLSTVEMRTALIRTLLPLMKLSNVHLEKSHAFIKGKFGEYNVHLGSGVVHMQAKGMLPIVPVHSGQRGRVFLPFADDDPKTAEILTKIIMLAEDVKIKDPKILDFIRV